ncbi:MAG: DUF308 domain-containing protein [Chloroflexaceae bacterium]
MTTETVSMRKQLMPWSRHSVWWFILIEGVLALIIGLSLVLVPPTGFGASLVAIYLIIDGVITIVQQLTHKNLTRPEAVKLMHGTVGLAVGLVVIVPRILIAVYGIPVDQGFLRPGVFDTNTLDTLNRAAFRLLLSVGGTGLMLWSLLRFWEAILDDDTEERMGDLLVGVVFLVIAVLVFLEVSRIANLGSSLGVFFLVVGVVLVLVAFLRRRSNTERTPINEVDVAEPEPTTTEKR